MAVVTTVPNHYKYLLKTKQIDESSDVYKIILMNTSFAFDKDAHALLADVTADQLATNYGYTQNSKTLADVAVTENDSTDKATTIWGDVTWTASGGSIGPFIAAIVYNDTAANDPIVMCIMLDAAETIISGAMYQITGISIEVG